MRVSRSQKTPRPKSAEESPLAGHHWCLRQRLSGPGPSCPGSPPPPAGPPPPGGPPLGHAFPARRRWGGGATMGGRVAGARASAGGLLGGRWEGSERLRGASRRGLPPDTGLGSVLSPAPSGRPRRLPHCSASRSCRIWGILGRPLGLPSLLVLLPLPFSSSFLFSPSPFYSLILLGVPSCGPVGGFFLHHGFGAVAGAGCGGLVWARLQRRALSLVATVAAAEAAAGEAARRRQATELVGDLGSFLLLGSTFLSTARHCLHYFS